MPDTETKPRFWSRLKLHKRTLGTLLTVLALALVFVVAMIARLAPMKYAFALNTVDPWFYYLSASYALSHGIGAWFHWTNLQEFYPYGKFVPKYESPMLVIVAVALYEFLRLLSVNVSFYSFAVVVPVVLTSVASVLMYFWGKEVGGKKTGILAALFLALSPANITETMLGEFKDEFLAFLLIVPAMYFLFKAMRLNSTRDMILCGILTSLAVATWGPVSPYFYDMPALIVFFTIISSRLSPQSGMKILALVCAPALLTASVLVRDSAGMIALLQESPVFLAFAFSGLKMYYDALVEESRAMFKAVIVFVGGALIIGTLVLFPTGVTGRILAIVDPFTRSSNALLGTVEENSVTTWIDFYSGFGIQMLLLPVAAYMFYRRADTTGIAMVLFIVTATYFTASYIRAEEILTPIAAIAAAYVLARLIDLFAPLVGKAYKTTSSNKRSSGIDWEIGGILLVIIVVSGAFYAFQGVTAANTPPLVLTGPNGGTNTDWVLALSWIKYNTPPNAVVASWWDYGYWIMAYSDRATLADPSTVNGTQIQMLALALMANSTVSLKILKYYHADYLVIYQPIVSSSGIYLPTDTGDLGKSSAMLTIAASTNFKKFNQEFGFNLSASTFSDSSNYLNVVPVSQLSADVLLPNGTLAGQTTLYRLMFGSDTDVQYTFSQLGSVGVSLPTFTVPAGFTLVYSTPDNAILVYQIDQ